MNKRRHVVALVGIVLIMGLLVACYPPEAEPAPNPPSWASQNDLKALQDKVDQKADTEYVVGQVKKLDESIGNIKDQPGGNTYSKDELYTRSEVEDKITALKKWVDDSYVKKGSGSTGNTSGTQTDQVTMRIYNSPSNLVYDPGSYTWWLEITNGYIDYRKVFVTGVFSYESTHNGDVQVWDGNLVSPAGTYLHSPELITGTNTSGVFSMLYTPSHATVSTDCSFFSGTSQGYKVMEGLRTLVIPVTLTLNYDTTERTKWTGNWSITATKHP